MRPHPSLDFYWTLTEARKVMEPYKSLREEGLMWSPAFSHGF